MHFENAKVRSVLRVLVAAAAISVAGSPLDAQTMTANWTATTGDYNNGGNWSTGVVPDASFGEIAAVNNGGTATVSNTPPAPGGIVLGTGLEESGSLVVQSGGVLNVETDPFSTDPDTAPPGTVVVGMEGEGHLEVQHDSMLRALGLSSGGADESSIVVGEAESGGAALAFIDGPMNLERTTRIVGTRASLAGSSLTLGDDHTLIAEITDATHSCIDVDGDAILAGGLEVEFNGYTPAIGDSWTLIDAASISGRFASVDADFDPGPGFGFSVHTNPGGTRGTVAELVLGAVAGQPGDYNGNGHVEQGDLNLVLLNWGEDGSTPPDEWTNDLPSGTIDQEELNGVLLGWGSQSPGGIEAATIPEPASLMLFLGGWAVFYAARPILPRTS